MSSKHSGFYTKTQHGHTAHVLGDAGMPEKTLSAIHQMIDIAYNKRLGTSKTHINNMPTENENQPEVQSAATLSFGQQLVGLKFNPSADDKVGRAKQLFAELADLVEQEPTDGSYVFNLKRGKALGEIWGAQMATVGVLTMKYNK